ncbi:DUF5004 domain-containing protein [Christiangramia aquimixticola]|uniref:DUF5004 domain-containing protein n=1 Tax=Christiangramia aquimixticola TaxID=1697558 RepID=UPI003AA803A8
MNNVFKIKYLSLLLLISFIGCSKNEAQEEAQLKMSNLTAITNNDMVGHWELSKITSDVEVDLDSNPGGSTNLMDETDCFNNMYITFDSNGSFITNNATMSFEAGDGDDFQCIADRMDNGQWEVRNDSLILTMNLNGQEYIHQKYINKGPDYFSLDITKMESNQYVSDPGNTRASVIRILELEYTRS